MNYKVYQGDELKQTVTDKIAVMNGLQPNKTYVFGVEPDTGQANLLSTNFQKNDQIIDGTSNTSEGWACIYIYDDLIAGTVYTFSSDVSVLGSATSIDVKPFDNLVTKGTIDDSYTTFPIVDGKISGLVKPTGSYNTLLVYAGNKGNTHGNKVTLHNMSLKRGRVAPNATTSVTTRGIRFNIPKTLTVGSNITLRYEEYPLGIVPIGNEPSGYFGGGNKQNLSATVISTANGSSVVEVAGNVIDVGGRNLLQGTSGELSGKSYNFADYQISGGLQPGTTYTLSGWARVDQTAMDNQQHVFLCAYTSDWSWGGWLNIDSSLTANYNKITFTTPSGKPFGPFINIYLSHPNNDSSKDSISGMGYISKLKLEQGDIATPYAAFVDGDTFTAQPDGTCALFSEHKALYY